MHKGINLVFTYLFHFLFFKLFFKVLSSMNTRLKHFLWCFCEVSQAPRLIMQGKITCDSWILSLSKECPHTLPFALRIYNTNVFPRGQKKHIIHRSALNPFANNIIFLLAALWLFQQKLGENDLCVL